MPKRITISTSHLIIHTNIRAFVPPLFLSLWDRLVASPLGYRLAKGAFWSLAGTLLSRGLGLCAAILVARMLGKTGFGELGIVQSTVGMLGTFAGLGLGLTATKHVAEFKDVDPARAGRIVGLSSLMSWIAGGVMAVLLLALGPWLAANTLAAPHLGGILRFASLLLLLGAVNGAQTGALAGFEAFRAIARINLITGVATFPLMVGGGWWRGMEGAVCGLVLSNVLNCLLNFVSLRAEAARAKVPLDYANISGELSILWRFSLPALGGSLFVGPVNWACSAMLVNKVGGYAEMGVFNAANQWFGAILFLPSALGQAALPVLAECLSRHDHAKARKVLGFYLKLNAAVIAPIVLVGCLVSPWIMASYGTGFGQAWLTLVVILITAGLLAVQTPIGQIIAASGRMWLGTLMNAGWAVCFVCFTWSFIHWGSLGLAGARLGAYLVHAIWASSFAIMLLRRNRNMETATIQD